MKMQITCNYCDYKWEQFIYSSMKDSLKCDRCGDKQLRVRDIADIKVDYYLDCTPFPNDSDSNSDHFGF